MTYFVKEIFLSLQGEGMNTGKTAVFCRFAGCNLRCSFCDTDFIGTQGMQGGTFSRSNDLAKIIHSLWPEQTSEKFVIFTGGEPALQLDNSLVHAVQRLGFKTAIETNGTVPLKTDEIDWICVSPKVGSELKVVHGHEMKVVYPQEGLNLKHYEMMDFEHFLLQPLDNEKQWENIQLAVQYCLSHPRWRLSLQTHKLIHIP